MTNDDRPEESGDDPRILDLARRYLAELEAGRTPDRESYLAQVPGLAGELGECLDGVELAHAMGVGLAPKSQTAGIADMNEPLGDFRILREIGRGGMGVVYEATQLSLGRRVALKVLPFAAGMDARQLQRFRTEAHAAAQLHHTGIVPVYAVGCERGTHFYAMQIIDGCGLDRVIRERRGDTLVTEQSTQAWSKAAPTRPPEVTRVHSSRGGQNREVYRTAARLISQVADALEYAHEAGVVHRDIKPANLLLDAKGNLWVTDFGLARVAAEAGGGGGPTRTGDIFGTLRYMSPEQASGRRLQIDHRTDIYSLGATFYELLTLRPIFPDDDRHALLHRIFHEDPAPPRQFDRGIPVELETILLKTLAKAPEERYATAGELAADLRRFLDERPILARRPSFADRVRKWLRRHPSAVVAAVVLLVFGLVALGTSTALVVREQQRTSEAYRRELQRAGEAEERFELARRSADEMIRIADEDLSDNPAQQLLRRRLLETALAFYRELIDLRGENADAHPELAATRNRVQSILEDLAVMRGAWRHLLLRNPGVQDDLRLDQAQRVAVREVLREIPNDGGPRGDAMRGRPFEQLIRDVRALEAAFRGILTVAQSQRLDQIGLQVRGAQAFREPEVIDALKLTREQREQVRKFEGPGFFDDDRRGPGGPGGGGPGPGGPGGFGGFGGPGGGFGGPFRDERQAMAKILEALTEPQRATWAELTGPTFRGDMREFRGGAGRKK